MEPKLKKRLVFTGILSFLGYFVGTTLYVFSETSNSTYKFLSGLLFAAIFSLSFWLFMAWKYPGIRGKEKQLAKDERNIYINGRSAVFTVRVTLATAVLTFFLGVVRNNLFVAYSSAGLYLFTILTMGLSRYFWERKT